MHSQDNLHSGPYKPVSLASSDITALLPCDEDDFKRAMVPSSRAALEGTIPALQNPGLTTLRPRSLFATLIQTHHLWGIVARRAVANDKCPKPGTENSEYTLLAKRLQDFENNLFQDHKFGIKSLKGHRQDNEDLVSTKSDTSEAGMANNEPGVLILYCRASALQYRIEEILHG